MTVFHKRYSTEDLIHIFVYCAFPIHVWNFISMLRDIPSWLFYMNHADIIGSTAYHLTFTLFESTLASLVILGIGYLLPKKWVPEPFLTLSAVLLIEFTIMSIVFQHIILQYSPLHWLLVSYLVVLALTVIITPRINELQKAARLIAERLTVLTVLYVIFDIIGLIIVIARNLVSAT